MAIRPPSNVVELAPPAERPDYPGADRSTAQLMIWANSIVVEALGVDGLYMRSHRRGSRRMAHARQLAMALVHLVCGRSQEDVARCYKRNRTTASHHMEMVEALNDVPEHEDFWNLLAHRFVLLIQFMSLPNGQAHWRAALHGIERALDEGGLEGEAVDQARHVRGVFWEDRIRA